MLRKYCRSESSCVSEILRAHAHLQYLKISRFAGCMMTAAVIVSVRSYMTAYSSTASPRAAGRDTVKRVL